jgi:hypothetical protein
MRPVAAAEDVVVPRHGPNKTQWNLGKVDHKSVMAR